MDRRNNQQVKAFNGHTRYILEVLHHKIVPRITNVTELLKDFSKDVYDQMTCQKIKKELDELGIDLTRLILKEMKRDRKKR